MSKNLALTDFRAVRRVLEPHVFASGGNNVPPTDLINWEVWDGIMHLPDDVAIRISNHHGTHLKLLYSLWEIGSRQSVSRTILMNYSTACSTRPTAFNA